MIDWWRWRAGDDYSVGLEEEVMLLDPDDWSLKVMPRAAIRAGAAQHVLPLEGIAKLRGVVRSLAE